MYNTKPNKTIQYIQDKLIQDNIKQDKGRQDTAIQGNRVQHKRIYDKTRQSIQTNDKTKPSDTRQDDTI